MYNEPHCYRVTTIMSGIDKHQIMPENGSVFVLSKLTIYNTCDMKVIPVSFDYKVYSSSDEMDEADAQLLNTAIGQLDKAYAPYSGFHVGAAARLQNGEVYIGSNQENASYPLCMCGERVALYNAAAYRPDIPVTAVAIVIKNTRMPISGPVSPCGACRQVISEYENKHGHKIKILLKSDPPEIYEVDSVSDLLPLGFNASFL